MSVNRYRVYWTSFSPPAYCDKGVDLVSAYSAADAMVQVELDHIEREDGSFKKTHGWFRITGIEPEVKS